MVRTGSRITRQAMVIAAVIGCSVWSTARGEGESPSEVVVSEEHLALGTVYYVLPTKKPAITFTSKAKNETFKGKSSAVAGYCIVPGKEGELPAKLAAGMFSVPVVSLDTGRSMMNDHLRQGRWLNASAYPNITFRLSEVRDVTVIREKEDVQMYKGTLVGEMTLLSTSLEVEIPARITFRQESKKTRKIGPGNHIGIKCKYVVPLADFGIAEGDKAFSSGKVSQEINVNIDLTLSNVKPGASS